ncbi:MAG: hypothetical protein NT049_18675, partial [Planctomycetota bacterium]|nr:hypothetical protein [Planctomycetota bacterium]
FDDLVLGIREGMKRMREEALAGLKYTQNVLAAAQKEQAIKMQIAMIGADPFNKRLMEINEKARQESEAEKKRAADAGGMTPANLGVLARIEERRQKETAAAYGERDSAAGDKRLKGLVAEQEKVIAAPISWARMPTPTPRAIDCAHFPMRIWLSARPCSNGPLSVPIST